MMILNVLVIAIVFLGFVFGLILNKVVREEIKPGKKYFLILEKVLLIAIILGLIFFTKEFSFLYLICLIIGFFIAFLIEQEYFYFGIIIVLAILLNNKSYLAFFSSLIFVMGLVLGSLLDFKTEKIKLKFLFTLILFLIPFVLLFFKTFSLTNLNYFQYFVIGALINGLVINSKLFKLRK